MNAFLDEIQLAYVATGKPHKRLILRGVIVIDGTGGPPFGPADIVIEMDTITRIVQYGTSPWQNQSPVRLVPGPEDAVLDLDGCYILPGLVDAHAHIGGPAQVPSAEYVHKLWLGHGVTTVRELGSIYNGLDFTLEQARLSNRYEIAAPDIVPYVYFGWGADHWISDPDEARAWVRTVAAHGAKGIKLFGLAPNVMKATLEEAQAHNLQTACHHAQQYVSGANALDTARWGLKSVEHWYGIPEAMFTDRRVQDYPSDYNYVNEADRFAAAGRLWEAAAPPGSARWNDTIDEFVSLGTALVPTFNVYIGARDAARVRTSEWHPRYTARELKAFFSPNSGEHGSFFENWGTEEEVSWRRSYSLWMSFIRDFYDRGGLLGAGSDSGFIYKVYGFGLIEELELLREAGVSALEVIGIATLGGAKIAGIDTVTGSIEVGKRADLLIVQENPLKNLKVLYGHGHSAEEADGGRSAVGGVTLTIKAGAVFNARDMLSDVRDIVAEQSANGAIFETVHDH
ncbi:amidohydrolase family protein [Cryobacterium sp. TMT1-66-1]|uniref:amidohydrolase family protein n=1 Tax=Cryobacterium sp. TMT1-66-1 TaxID=1259242 RepID=UPI0018E0C02F|nr:amidohydrolase family protein [Cryobacterium sp. TMT1-66-1]